MNKSVSSPLISVVIPVYQVEAYLTACLESVAAQRYRPLEVIFVDDCGTDRSVEIIADYVAAHPFPPHRVVRHAHNRGLSAARNTGLDAAAGAYVYFLDSDDTLSDRCLETLAAPLQQQTYEVVIGGYAEVFDNGDRNLHPLPHGPLQAPLRDYADGRWYVMAWNKLCNRRFLLQNHLYFKEGLLHEDVAWSFRLACACRSMFAVDSVTYNYRIRGASIMTGMSVERDVEIYLQAFAEVRRCIVADNLLLNPHVYRLVEGKKSTILFSLLQKGEQGLYKKCYPLFHRQQYLSPLRAYRSGVIGLPYLFRDLHYCLPVALGRLYKQAFYWLYYRARGRQLRGAVWK